MRTITCAVFLILLTLVACGHSSDPYGDWPMARDPRKHAENFPDWAFAMRLWPFDILTPEMTDRQIEERLENALDAGADSLIFYIEAEHMFGTFVREAGFSGMLTKINHLTAEAQNRDLHTIVYLNGLEVMTRAAVDSNCNSTGITTMATLHPDWLQYDLDGDPIVYTCQSADWLESDWEDAWMSPYSGYRDFFKDRIRRLAGAGVDGIYIDATFLPGYQEEGASLRWGSTDQAFAAEFLEATGYELPTAADFDNQAFQAFLSYRHQALADYLGDLADTAWQEGLVPFWESSTNDTPEGTLLGNETAVTGRRGLGFSPEIEPEGDWLAAFRMAKAARELNQERPIIYLGWPEENRQARIEFALAIAHSGTYYPTDFLVADGSFDMMDNLQTVFNRRVSYSGSVALVYSVRNKDLSYREATFFDLYVEAFEELTVNHIPFKIVPLEYIAQDGLEGVDIVVLPGLSSISDEEADLLAQKSVVLLGDTTGSLDEKGQQREAPLEFLNKIDLDDISPVLPFGITAPKSTFIEYYGDRDGAHTMYLSVVSPNHSGQITLTAAPEKTITVTVAGLNKAVQEYNGEQVKIAVDASILVITVQEGS